VEKGGFCLIPICERPSHRPRCFAQDGTPFNHRVLVSVALSWGWRSLLPPIYNLDMAEVIRIHSRFATARDTARTLGVRASRAEKLITRVDDFIGQGLRSKGGQVKRKKNAAKPSVGAVRSKAKAAK
jgi:hypothetical protein